MRCPRNVTRNVKHRQWTTLACHLGIVAAGVIAVTETARSEDILARPFASSPSYSPSYSWAGAYIGAQAGYGWGRTEYSSPKPPGRGQDSSMIDGSGGAVGPYVGYNLQSGGLVTGIEADFAKTWLRGPSVIDPDPDSRITTKSEIDWTASVRGRVGYAFGNVMPYIAGGVTFAGVNFPFVLPAGHPVTRDNKQIRIGWTAGAGLEYALANNLIFRGEYRYTDLGEEFNVMRFDRTGVHPSYASVTVQEVRAGVALKFGDAPPPAIDRALSFSNAPPVAWSGLYAGALASFSQGNSNYTGLAFLEAHVPIKLSGTNPWLYAGYNFQFNRIVLGVEGDIQLANLSGGGALVDLRGVTDPDFRVTAQLNNAWSARGRLGFAFGNFLPYVTAGAAGGDYTHTIQFLQQRRSFDEHLASWTVGAGLEYALSDHIILRTEYRYTPYGLVTTYQRSPTNAIDLTVEEVRVGIAFKL